MQGRHKGFNHHVETIYLQLPEGERRLAAIMFTDIVGYTALAQRNEAAAMNLLNEHRTAVRPLFIKHNGKEVKTIGDAFLVEFNSALEAVRCAFDIQQSLRDLNGGRPAEKQVQLRVGIHLGDVIHSEGDVYGDAVNVASRIEPLANPGGISISEQVYDQVKNKLEFPMASLGKKELKNVGDAIEVFRVVLPWERQDTASQVLDKCRVAVLPFANMSPDPNDEYFADGMTEELIDRLAQVKGLEVIARTSVMSYKKKEKRVSEIARELEAGSVVEGSVRKAGNRVRVTAQLINGITQGHLWSSHYDGNLDDIFAVQSEIAEKVAGQLQVQLVANDRQVLGQHATANTEAYTRYLRGKEFLRKQDETSLRKALSLFEEAVKLDSSFARAHSELAVCYLALANMGYEPWESAIARAKPPLKKALELDPNHAEAHSTLSFLLFSEDDMVASEEEARKAIEISPSLAEAYDVLSNVEAVKGNPEESVRLTETCYHLDPIRPKYIADLGCAYFYSGRETEALNHWKKTAEPPNVGSFKMMAEYYLWKGDVDEAERLHAIVEDADPNSAWVKWMRGFINARSGNRDAALREIQRIKNSEAGALAYNHVGFIYYALRDLDSYFSSLHLALERHALDVGHVMYCPLFAESRNDARYVTLIDALRLMTGLSSA